MKKMALKGESKEKNSGLKGDHQKIPSNFAVTAFAGNNAKSVPEC